MSKSKRNKVWKVFYKKFKNEIEALNDIYSHPGIKGAENEQKLKAFIRKFLPYRFKLENKKILLDNSGKESTEQDIVIWDKIDTPRIFADTSYFLLDSILMCIEVKTTLNRTNLEDTLKKIRDLRRMDYFKRVTGDPRWQVHPPLCFIFAFDIAWKERGTLLKNIKEFTKNHNIKPSERFDYLYVMRKGIVAEWSVDYKFLGKVLTPENRKKYYSNICPINPRWPQFFPSKLIEDIPLLLSEKQVTQKKDLDDKNYSNLTQENQILGLLDFLKNLEQALEDQRIFHSGGIISMSYSKPKRGLSGRSSSKPF